MKLNKGEWGEPYVALRLLGDGRLSLADGNGDKRPNEWMNVVEVIRHETADRIVRYNRDVETSMVSVSVNGEECVRLPASDFISSANALKDDIVTGRGRSFSVSEDVASFLQIAEVLHLKAKSIDKSDIFLTTLDPRTSIERSDIGFSVKCKFGQSPTLFNTAVASGVRYKVDGMTKGLMDEINGLVDDKGHAAVSARCQRLISSGCSLGYVGYAFAKKAGCEAFKENLDLIDPRLPLVIERILWNHFFMNQDGNDVTDVVDRIIEQNPCGITRPEIKYPYMIKSFLYAAYCGMTASTLWSGKSDVNGGFIMVGDDGEVLAHYALESEDFKAYLYNNCYLEFPATSKKHGDYAYVYEEDGRYFFKLNFQIRYR